MVDSKENYKFDLGVKGLMNFILHTSVTNDTTHKKYYK